MQNFVGAIFAKRSRVLLGLRSPSKKLYPNTWDLIGGHVDAGESIEAAMIRESEEEVGAAPIPFDKQSELEGPKPELYGPSTWHIFLATHWVGPDPYLRSAEHTKIRCVTPSEAQGLASGHPSYHHIFEGLKNDGTLTPADTPFEAGESGCE